MAKCLTKFVKFSAILSFFKVKFSWSIVALQCCVSFLLYSKMNQSYIYIYPLFFRFPSHLGHHSAILSIYLFICLFVCLWLSLGLGCCAWAFSSCGEWGLLFVEVCGLLIVVGSLVAEHGL